MSWKLWAGIIIGMVVLYYLINWLFVLCLLLVIIYILYLVFRFLERQMTPHGKRIRHGALRGHLETEYGTKEGGKLYKEMVGELRKKGYR